MPQYEEAAQRLDEGVSRAPDEADPAVDVAAPELAPVSAVPTSHPTGFWFFFWGELAERCSYYGMRAILALYIAEQLGLGEQTAEAAMHGFIAACYLLTLPGGWLADRFIGKYWSIVSFSIPYILGHVILGFENVWCLVIALVLLATGTGVTKPNISTLMGLTYDAQRPGQERLRSDAFAMFYGAINIGSAISTFAMPWIRENYGYRLAFLFPAGLMTLALLIFALGKPFYAVETISRREKTPEERAAQRDVLARISGIFLLVSFVWCVQDQSASTWTFFARDYLNLHLFGPRDVHLFGRTFQMGTLAPDMIQGINPVLIVILLPFVTWFWHALAGRGMKLRPTDKMLIGFFLVILSMVVMSVAGFLTSERARISVLWEIAAYVVITLAEACISVVGLELAFTAAPRHMKGFVTGCWLLTMFVGNTLAIPISLLYKAMSPGPYFSLLTVMMLAVTAAFVVVAGRFNRRPEMTNDEIRMTNE